MWALSGQRVQGHVSQLGTLSALAGAPRRPEHCVAADRVATGEVTEVILAVGDGRRPDYGALHSDRLEDLSPEARDITRLAHGVPVGVGDYFDDGTLSAVLKHGGRSG